MQNGCNKIMYPEIPRDSKVYQTRSQLMLTCSSEAGCQ